MAARKNVTDEAEKEVIQETAEQVEQPEQAEKVTKYLIRVSANPSFCGVGAGGVQFANGQAVVTSERMAEWFKEHNGYSVTAE